MLLIAFIASAQDVTHKDIKFKRKKGFVIVNDQNVFTLKKSGMYYYLHDLTSDEELIYIYFNNNETIEYIEDDYIKVYFTNTKQSFETKSHYKIIMARLINENVITADWKIDDTKTSEFALKYDAEISGRTIR